MHFTIFKMKVLGISWLVFQYFLMASILCFHLKMTRAYSWLKTFIMPSNGVNIVFHTNI